MRSIFWVTVGACSLGAAVLMACNQGGTTGVGGGSSSTGLSNGTHGGVNTAPSSGTHSGGSTGTSTGSSSGTHGGIGTGSSSGMYGGTGSSSGMYETDGGAHRMDGGPGDAGGH